VNNLIENVFSLPAVEAAPKLLGYTLKRQTPDGLLALKIVETEAYHQDDPASHSFRGETKRTAPMFKAGGHIYVYFTYGVHYCINIVTGPAGRGEAVLLRAGEPLEGLEIMRKNRGGNVSDINLANGPGKLAQALGIKDTKLSGEKLNMLSSWLENGDEVRDKEIIVAPRIGITHGAEALMRFYIKDNPFVSRYNKR